ncbi:hypothetical protein T439DRAFT_352200 [Meredithblackwellia eburnea MCA 4105]
MAEPLPTLRPQLVQYYDSDEHQMVLNLVPNPSTPTLESAQVDFILRCGRAKTEWVRLPLSTTITHLKMIIATTWGIASQDLALILNGKRLEEDHLTLAESDIYSEATLHVTLSKSNFESSRAKTNQDNAELRFQYW